MGLGGRDREDVTGRMGLGIRGAGMTNFYFYKELMGFCIARGDFVLGGFWLGGILSKGILSGGILARGDFVLGGFCPGGYCPGGF